MPSLKQFVKKRKRLLICIFFVLLLLVGGPIIIYNICEEDLPSLAQLHNIEPSLITKIYSADGKVIKEFYTERRILIPLERMPPHLIDALLATEDRRFFKHWGVNLMALARAFWNNLWEWRWAQGASTITQQLARTLFLTPEKTISRKIKEILTAMKIERNYSKEEILEMYLNQCYFGKGAYGVQAAALVYFNKNVEDLSVSECAILIGIPKNPSRYSPVDHPKLAQLRRNIVLNAMKDFKKIAPGVA
ncbi:MAG: hypothetical protein AMJ73_06725, partial [candidate division Zixibacteria bacterium SM1_73]